MDPDSLVRGPLHIPAGAHLLGSRVNKGLPRQFRKILKTVPGAVSINEWGATPAIFKTDTFKVAYANLKRNESIFDRLSLEFPAMYAHDLLLPAMFALIGKREMFNPDIVECLRQPEWERMPNPLVHQFRKYYK